ncbi:MAG: TIGR00282 family metallophosphoesterase [Candidatus Tectomicrobia bacterium]|nr:TIGR00282 family metallophosphoesterase [Candidatus Tectomicrobia bacterium]
MKLVYIGDIFGKPGRMVVQRLLGEIVQHYGADVCIANCENAAGGAGVTPAIIDELLKSGINVLTSGNHVWDKKEVFECISHETRLLRPANYPEDVPGRGSHVVVAPDGTRIGVLNLMGRVFMSTVDCPFRKADEEIERLRPQCEVIFVDMHAEATSEKIAMGWYLDGRVSAVVGSHTHVQTADERILPRGTAYITDVGMTGPYDSVIGIQKEIVIEKFLSQMPKRFEAAKKDAVLAGVVVTVELSTGRATNIRRLLIPLLNGREPDLESASLASLA